MVDLNRMNTLGRWIAMSALNRKQFADKLGVSESIVNVWCGKSGVSPLHAPAVSKETRIPIDKLVVKKQRREPDKPLTWGGCWVE